jgi:dTDP-4-amino-4,6-dideoxygalactose transaminase
MMRLSRSVVGSEEAAAASRVIVDDGYLGMGAEVQRFETELAAFFDVSRDRVACVNSGTAAVQLAVQAAVEPGAEILVQSLTFVATFQAIAASGAVPVPCEIDPSTITIDLDDAARRITPRTRAIMPVHYASYPGPLDEIYAFARAHGLRVIEDAAHAFGGVHRGRRIGADADVAAFSFDGIKNITTGEGGAVVSSDPDVCARVRDARLLGVQQDTEKRYAGERSWEFDVSRPGVRAHMSNIFAAIGRVQLRRLPAEFGPKRVSLAARYRERLASVVGVRLLRTDLSTIIPHIQPVLIQDARRDQVRSALEKAGIQTGIHYKPNHLLTLFGGGRVRLPVTEQAYEQLLSLPLHPALSHEDVDRVCDAVAAALQGCEA